MIQNLDLFGEPVVTVFYLNTGERFVYNATLNSGRISFSLRNGQIVDNQTGSIWDMRTGEALFGQMAGLHLESSSYSGEDIFPYKGIKAYNVLPLALWQRFDTNWYTAIAKRGYVYVADGIHFPPLYPLGIRIFSAVFKNVFLSGLILSHLATLIVFKLLYDLFHSWGKSSLAQRGLMYFLVFPTSFYLFAAYTESLFLVTVLFSFQSMQKSEWQWAGFWTFCAILTRLTGVALFFPLVYGLWKSRKNNKTSSAIFGIFVAGFAVIFYFALRYIIGVDSIIPTNEMVSWHVHIVFPWESFSYAFKMIFSGNAAYTDWLNLFIALGFLGIIFAGWKKIPLEYNLFMISTWLVITSRQVETMPLISVSRYVLTLFPAFFQLAEWGKSPIVNRLILYCSFTFNLFLTTQFWMWSWVA